MKIKKLVFGFSVSYLIIFLLSFCVLSSTCHAADELKIGYVNFSVLFEGYYKTEKAEAELKDEADKREEMIEEIRGEINNIRKKLGSGVLKQEEKDKQKGVLEQKALQLNRVIRESKRELESKREKSIRGIIKDIEAVIREYSGKKGYTLVMGNRDLLYVDKKLDITKHIEDLLKKKELKENGK
ncbi:OmpH family outer membrane protein [bacterium]|nr:OmpH family outer membrane protein [bacterium]